MMPRVIVHNTVSLDGSFAGFEVDLGVHYARAAAFRPDAHLVGSETARLGVEAFGGAPPETDELRAPRAFDPDDARPLWVIVDSRGQCEGLLHAFRGSGYCRDVAVLISERTPPSYSKYLDSRGYLHWIVGEDRVDLRAGLLTLRERGMRTALVDSGPGLVGALLEQDLVADLSLVIAPVLAGAEAPRLLAQAAARRLRLRAHEGLEGGHIALLYGVEPRAEQGA